MAHELFGTRVPSLVVSTLVMSQKNSLLLPAKVYRVGLWMRLYGHSSDKRTLLWSSSYDVWRLNKGRMHRRKNAARSQTTKRYVSREGQRRFTANKDELKNSQNLGSNLRNSPRSATECALGLILQPFAPESFASANHCFVQRPSSST